MYPNAIAPTTATPPHPALRYGLLVGAILLAVEVVHGVVGVSTLPLGVTAVFFLIALAGLLFAGARAAAVTGKVGTGALAGLLASILLGIGYAIGTTIGAATNFATLRATYQAAAAQSHIPYSDQLVVAGTILTILLSFLVGLAAGTVVGAIGGLVGARRARSA